MKDKVHKHNCSNAVPCNLILLTLFLIGDSTEQEFTELELGGIDQKGLVNK